MADKNKQPLTDDRLEGVSGGSPWGVGGSDWGVTYIRCDGCGQTYPGESMTAAYGGHYCPACLQKRFGIV